MSFSVTAEAGAFEWKGVSNNWREPGLFAQRRNLMSPFYLWCHLVDAIS
jgi:uncharacterized protein